jgi:hypothetical protein
VHCRQRQPPGTADDRRRGATQRDKIIMTARRTNGLAKRIYLAIQRMYTATSRVGISQLICS